MFVEHTFTWQQTCNVNFPKAFWHLKFPVAYFALVFFVLFFFPWSTYPTQVTPWLQKHRSCPVCQIDTFQVANEKTESGNTMEYLMSTSPSQDSSDHWDYQPFLLGNPYKLLLGGEGRSKEYLEKGHIQGTSRFVVLFERFGGILGKSFGHWFGAIRLSRFLSTTK